MSRKSFFLLLISICVAFTMVLFIGCGGDDDDDDEPTTPTTPIDVTGDWEISGPGLGLNVLHLVQNGQTITGTVDRAAPDGGWDYGTITAGSNVNNTVNITIQYDDMQILELTGTLSDANTISGTYRSYYDPSAVDSDAWSGTRRT